MKAVCDAGPFETPARGGGVIRMLALVVDGNGKPCSTSTTVAVYVRYVGNAINFDIVGDYTMKFIANATDPKLQLLIDGTPFAERRLWRSDGMAVLIGEEFNICGGELT